jgi:hypothetical protein
VLEVVPELGRTVLMRHSEKSFHGNSKPVNAPGGRPRRAVAAYYYGNHPELRSDPHHTTIFYEPVRKKAKRVKSGMKYLLPPALIDLAKYVRRKRLRRS